MSARLDARTVIDLWDAGADRSPVDRAVTLASRASGVAPEAVEALAVGERDRLLLQARAAMFGDLIDSVTECPSCGQTLEVGFAAGSVCEAAAGASRTTEVSGHVIRWRLPRSSDLRAIAGWTDVESARAELLGRCIEHARRGADSVDALPSDVADAVAADMERADPCGAIFLRLSCDACEHEWEAPFDPADFFAKEIERAAGAVVEEVAALAGAYGWSESEILQMSPARRARYLEFAP